MSVEQAVCDLVQQHWNDLNPGEQAPTSLIFMKVAGKTSPNGSIIGLVLDSHRQRPVAIAKIPRNPEVTPGLDREYEAMLDVSRSFSNPVILDRVPHRTILSKVNGVKILLQAACHGHPMVREMTSRPSIEILYSEILPWMLEFHATGAESLTIEDEHLHLLVEAPITAFMDHYRDQINNLLSSESRQYLLELPRKVSGRAVRMCRQHGDFNAHNTLIQKSGDVYKDFALIDWEDYQNSQLPIYDLNHFFISNSKVVGQGTTAEESFLNIFLKDGWYRNLYQASVSEYDNQGIIDTDTFELLTPLYLVNECLRAASPERNQEATAPTWMNRLNLLIEYNSQA